MNRQRHLADEMRSGILRSNRKRAKVASELGAALVVTSLCLGACADSAAVCTRAGGEYANGACTLSGPSQQAVRQWCDAHGGVHLAGPNICGYGSGGP